MTAVLTRSEIQRPLIRKGLESFIIGAPQVVSLDRYTTFPVAILRTRKIVGASKIDFRKTAIIAAMELNTYRLSARLAFANSPQPRSPNGTAAGSRSGAKDSFSNDPTAMAAEGSTLDLATLLRLPAGRVLSQSPRHGRRLVFGAKVSLVVSRGRRA